jgi:hypothetical protein
MLLGSSARRLNTAGTNLLAGRAALRHMYPLVPAELSATSIWLACCSSAASP